MVVGSLVRSSSLREIERVEDLLLVVRAELELEDGIAQGSKESDFVVCARSRGRIAERRLRRGEPRTVRGAAAFAHDWKGLRGIGVVADRLLHGLTTSRLGVDREAA